MKPDLILVDEKKLSPKAVKFFKETMKKATIKAIKNPFPTTNETIKKVNEFKK